MMLHQTFNFATIGSTQEEAKKIARRLPAGSVAVVAAKAQEGGRGRSDHIWVSPKGNLYLTFILPIPEQRKMERSNLSLVLATTTVEFLEGLGVEAKIKWPNDLLIGRAKLGGILGEGGDPLFLGIGINVASRPALDRPTASLNETAATQFDLEHLKEGVVTSFLEGYEKWLEEGFAPFFALWSSYLIHQPDDLLKIGAKSAKFLKTDLSGGIWIEMEGQKKLILSGEIDF